MAKHKPVFIVIAGPNGAGKTTLYQQTIRHLPEAGEFVNADELAKRQFGHAAETKEESEVGQRLAEDRRRELMAARKPIVTESTFSHPSKVDLVREAKAAGYDVRLYHVNVRSPDLAVMRVSSRVQHGGHNVPEQKTRERYERNQPLIREAAMLADSAYVYDNSKINEPHRLSLVLNQGKAHHVDNPPPWARSLYAKELEHLTPTQVNSPAASYEAAKAMAAQLLGPQAETLIVRDERRTYNGKILGQTAMHTVQQVGPRAVVTHFTTRLSPVPEVGADVAIEYRGKGLAETRQLQERTPEGVAKAQAFLHDKPADAVKKYPDLANAYGAMHAASLQTAAMPEKSRAQVLLAFQQKLVDRIERSEKLPELQLKTQAKDTGRER